MDMPVLISVAGRVSRVNAYRSAWSMPADAGHSQLDRLRALYQNAAYQKAARRSRSPELVRLSGAADLQTVAAYSGS